MSAYVVRSVRLVCDTCATGYEWTMFDTVQDAVARAVVSGWTTSGPLGRILICPDCLASMSEPVGRP